VQQALSLYWQPIYPLLEEYGETDPFYRINALAGLSDKSAHPRLSAAGQFINQSRTAAGIIRAFGFTAIEQRLRIAQ
jgi:hypothetical protein